MWGMGKMKSFLQRGGGYTQGTRHNQGDGGSICAVERECMAGTSLDRWLIDQFGGM